MPSPSECSRDQRGALLIEMTIEAARMETSDSEPEKELERLTVIPAAFSSDGLSRIDRASPMPHSTACSVQGSV